MQIPVDPRKPSTTLEDLVQQMLPPDISHVLTLREEHKAPLLNAEEAFIAWTMGLPDGSDVAASARVALTQLQALRLRHTHPNLTQFERYLQEAITAVPGVKRRGGRRRRQG